MQGPGPRVGSVVKGIALGALALGALAFAAAALLVMLAVWNLTTLPDRAVGSAGERVGALLGRGGETVGALAQAVADARDPAHPPRAPLPLDTPFDAIVRLSAGDDLPGGGAYRLTLREVRWRQDAATPEAGQYAVVHRELREPRATRLFGQTLRVEKDEQDYYLYPGQTLRLGRDLYKVNWVSPSAGRMGLALYRQPDRYTGPLVIDLD